MKIGLVVSCHGFSHRLEAKLPDWSSRRCKSRNLPCTAAKGLSETTTLEKPGSGGRYHEFEFKSMMHGVLMSEQS